MGAPTGDAEDAEDIEDAEDAPHAASSPGLPEIRAPLCAGSTGAGSVDTAHNGDKASQSSALTASSSSAVMKIAEIVGLSQVL